jgi:predicted site-specific integrase-resolvase
MQPQPPAVMALRINDFCKSVGISRATFYKYRKIGLIRSIRIGGRVLVPHAEALRIATEGLN